MQKNTIIILTTMKTSYLIYYNTSVFLSDLDRLVSQIWNSKMHIFSLQDIYIIHKIRKA